MRGEALSRSSLCHELEGLELRVHHWRCSTELGERHWGEGVWGWRAFCRGEQFGRVRKEGIPLPGVRRCASMLCTMCPIA